MGAISENVVRHLGGTKGRRSRALTEAMKVAIVFDYVYLVCS